MSEYDSLITVKDAASMLGVTTATLRNWDKSGKLKAIRHPINNYRMYRLSDIVPLLKNANPTTNSLNRTSSFRNEAANFTSLSLVDKKEFRTIVRQMSKAFRDSEGGGIVERFEETSKLLFCKMFDENEVKLGNKTKFELCVNPDDSIESVHNRVNQIFQRVLENYPDIFVNGRKQLSNDKKAIFEICKILQPYKILDVSDDLKGLIYEEMIRNTFEKNENQQFFTPRIIIDFIIQLVNPTENDVICDPACGSGGFLIGTMQWIKDCCLNENSDKLIEEYCRNKILGVEIDSRMVWVSTMNILMHGGVNGVIKYLSEGGSLAINDKSSKVLKNNSVDIIITNPPFGSDFSDESSLNKYVIGENKKSRRRGALFVERSLQLLKPGGKLAIILDDGVLNGSTNEDIRKLIFEKSIVEAVISLPEVTFLPYSSAKTSILFLRKKSKKEDNSSQKDIFIANIENIGRRPNGDPLYSNERDENGKLKLLNDLPQVVEAWKKYLSDKSYPISDEFPSCFICSPDEFYDNDGKLFENRLDAQFHHPAKKVAKETLQKSIYPTPTVAELSIERNTSVLPKIEFSDEVCRFVGLANITPNNGEYFFSEMVGDRIKSSVKYFKGGDILFSKLRPELRKCVFIDDSELDGYTSAENIVIRALDKAKNDPEFLDVLAKRNVLFDIDSEYLAFMLRSDVVFGQLVYQITGVGRPRISKSAFFNLKIPLPPIREQKEIVKMFKEAFITSSNLNKQSQMMLLEADKIVNDVYKFVQNKLCPDN